MPGIKKAAPVKQNATETNYEKSTMNNLFCLPSVAYVNIHESLQRLERDTGQLLANGSIGNRDIFAKMFSDNIRDIKEQMLKGHFEGRT